MEKIKKAIEHMREHHALWYDQESIDRFGKALSFVTNIEKLKFLDKQTQIIDIEDGCEPYSLSRWQAEIEGAPKLHELVRVCILSLSKETKFLDELNIYDARYLFCIMSPLYNDELKSKYGDLVRKLQEKLPAEKEEEQKQKYVASPSIFPKMIHPEKIDRINDLLLSHRDDDFTDSDERDLFFGELDEIDNFFKDKEKDSNMYKPIALYKTLLRRCIKNFDLIELENLYHETLYNSVSSKIILERYSVLAEKKSKNMSSEEINEIKNKLISFRKTNHK